MKDGLLRKRPLIASPLEWQMAAAHQTSRLMAQHPYRLLVITSTLRQVKSPYAHTSVDPDRTTQFLIAVLAGLQVPFVSARHTNWDKSWLAPIGTKFISTTGWSRTITARSLEVERRRRRSSAREGF